VALVFTGILQRFNRKEMGMEIDIHDASPCQDSLNGTTYTPTASIALVITRQGKA
jgi:hypothetical protein